MINRVLIRIKVVQLLYSYLLTRNDFTLPEISQSPSRDKAFGFILYHDLLLLLLKISGLKPGSRIESNRYMSENLFLKTIARNQEIKTRIDNYAEGFTPIEAVISQLHDAIIKSKFYRSYVHTKNRDIAADINFLLEAVETIRGTKAFYDIVRSLDGFTNAGYDYAFTMLTDTIRSFGDNKMGYAEARNSLRRSLDKAYDLYHALLLFIPELTQLRDQALDAAKHKHLPTAEDLNPNMKFANNRLATLLSESETFNEYFNDNPFSWIVTNPALLQRLLTQILNSDVYAEYMESDDNSLAADCEFWKNVYRKIILPSDELAETLENMSVYWNDDLNVVDSFVLKTIKRIGTEGTVNLLPKYKDDEDARFGAELFETAVEHREEYRQLIDRFINQKQWDSDRLAFMDIVIMIAAISELLKYPQIPLPVTLNEYIEIANCYSTPKSGQFINGILYSVINYLKEEGRLNKN